MTALSLLCPLRDFPFMLPGCFPLALVLVVTALLPVAALLFRLAYYLRHQRLHFSEAVLVRGRIAGLQPGEPVGQREGGGGPACWFLLHQQSGSLLPVMSESAALAGRRRLRGGQAVTVLGLAGSVPRPGEALFRQPAAVPGVQALQIAPDRLSLVRLLTWGALISWFVFALWLSSTIARGRRSYAAPTSVGEATTAAGEPMRLALAGPAPADLVDGCLAERLLPSPSEHWRGRLRPDRSPPRTDGGRGPGRRGGHGRAAAGLPSRRR